MYVSRYYRECFGAFVQLSSQVVVNSDIVKDLRFEDKDL